MGLRGPVPMSDAEREARHGRDRSKPHGGVPARVRDKWVEHAEALEEQAMALIKESLTEPFTESRANGAQMSPKFAAGIKLFATAEKFYARVYRILEEAPKGAEQGATPGKAPSLSAYRKQRQGEPQGESLGVPVTNA